MDSEGWVKVCDLCKLMPITKVLLDEIVVTDSKGRYSYSDDGESIRANQGHSIDVDVGLRELVGEEVPEYLYHGTATRFLKSIWAQGLLPMTRKHVHLSIDAEVAKDSGARHGKPIILVVKARILSKDGYKVWVSSNGVYLMKSVPIGYFEEQG